MADSGSSSVPKYFVTSAHVGFRLWPENDVSLALAFWGDPEVTCYIDARGALDVTEVGQEVYAELQSQAEYGIQHWSIFLEENG